MKTKNAIILCSILSISLLACNSKKSDTESTTSFEESSESISESAEDLLSNVSEITRIHLDDKEKPFVKWEGRYEYKVLQNDLPDMVYLYHAATGFTVDFYGTKLEVGFCHYRDDGQESNIYYDLAIDDETLPNPVGRRFYLKKAAMTEVITLCDELPLGHHRVKCLKMDEARDATTGVYSFKTDGSFYYRDKNEDNKNLKFMFICASGGSGYGALAYTEDANKNPARYNYNSSALHSFNYLAARRYNADVQYVATSGWGVRYPENRQVSEILDNCGVTSSNTVATALTTGEWNYQRYVPDYIIFNIGGNDTKQSSFNVDKYKEKVVEMVQKLHGYYPRARMLWTHTASTAGGYAINALSNAGIIREGYIHELVINKVGAGLTGEGTYGAADHYSLKTQIDNAKIIVDKIAEEWRLLPSVDAVTFEQFESIISFVDNN